MKILIVLVTMLLCDSCAFDKAVSSSDKLLVDNTPDTKSDFLKYRRKCLRIKKGFMGHSIDNTTLLTTSFEGEVDDKFKYTYLIWVYTGFYDTQQMEFPYYIYPNTPKGRVMNKGCLRGVNLKTKN